MNNDKMITVNGKTYFSATYNRCPVCTPRDEEGKPKDDRYMFIKLRTASGDTLLECPNCDYELTVAPGMVNINANKSTTI